MSRTKRTCCTCKTVYEYCPSCRVDSHKPTWMFAFCSELCKELYEIISNNGTLDEIETLLNKHGVENYSIFTDDIVKYIDGLLCDEKEKEETANIKVDEEK